MNEEKIQELATAYAKENSHRYEGWPYDLEKGFIQGAKAVKQSSQDEAVKFAEWIRDKKWHLQTLPLEEIYKDFKTEQDGKYKQPQ